MLLLRQFGKVIEVVGGARNQHALRLVGHLTAVSGFHVSNFRDVLCNQVAQPAYQSGTLFDGCA